MATFSKKHRREDLTMVRRVTRDAHLLNRLNLRLFIWNTGLFLLLAVTLSLIAFFGRPPYAPMIHLGQRPSFAFEAPFDFSYESKIRFENNKAAARAAVLPVFRVNSDAVDAKAARYKAFAKELGAAHEALALLPEAECRKHIADMPSALALSGSVRGLAVSATRAIRASGSGAYLEFFFNDAIQQYEELSRNGLYDESTFGGALGGDSAVRLLRGSSRRREMHALDAILKFKKDLSYQASVDAQPGAPNQEMAQNLSRALFDLLQPAFTPTIEADAAETERARIAAEKAVEPQYEIVKAGTLLVERDVEVGKGTLERWRAFREALAKREKISFGLSYGLIQNVLVGTAIMAVVVLFSRLTTTREIRRKRSLTLATIAVIINVAALRLGLEFSESSIASHIGGEAVLWGGVFVFAPLFTVMLADLSVATLTIFTVAGFASAMHGNSLESLLAVSLGSLVAIRVAQSARQRSRIILAGLLSSAPVALFAYYQVSDCALTREAAFSILAAVISGLLSGALVALLLPLAERLFKTTTNITLLDLSDYNHPLLRKLQLLAPGTFHHSVMVANIAERAAMDIRANAEYCRCAALYHDIGKMAKPDYFIENQRQGANPHAEIAPSMSALVIKSHVREGIEIAREYRLPRMIIDVIEQHHGTGLISYFFHKARKNCADGAAVRTLSGMDSSPLPPPDDRGVDESLYRYDGPKPKTREGAIILLADSVEAASRSLKKVTPQTVEELVNAIVNDRIDDGQLNDCPLTFKDVQKLRVSLNKSLLASLHQRVEYPQESAAGKPVRTHAEKTESAS